MYTNILVCTNNNIWNRRASQHSMHGPVRFFLYEPPRSPEHGRFLFTETNEDVDNSSHPACILQPPTQPKKTWFDPVLFRPHMNNNISVIPMSTNIVHHASRRTFHTSYTRPARLTLHRLSAHNGPYATDIDTTKPVIPKCQTMHVPQSSAISHAFIFLQASYKNCEPTRDGQIPICTSFRFLLTHSKKSQRTISF